MTPWKHPTLGWIEQIPVGLQPKKVWKHFFDEAEHWERLCDADVAGLRGECERRLGISRSAQRELPPDSRHLVQGPLRRAHDEGYGLVYLQEIASPETRWTEEADANNRHYALTPKSVLVIVQRGKPHWIVTAFRPLPQKKTVLWDEAAFLRYGKGYFLMMTQNLAQERVTTQLAERLAQVATAAPTTADELWWLASATGYGRLMGNCLEIADALSMAEARLAETAPELLKQLQGELDWEGCLAKIAMGLKEDRPEDLEAALASTEELLAIAPVIGAELKAAEFLSEAEPLIAWLPVEWNHLIDYAGVRCQLFKSAESFALKLWSFVEEVAMGSVIRQEEPTLRPAATLVDRVLIDEGSRFWQGHIAAQKARKPTLIKDALEWLKDSLESLQISEPIPVMGGADEAAATEPYELHGRPAAGIPFSRIFVIAGEHPAGHELTHRYTLQDGRLWLFDHPDERVLVVLVVGERPIEGANLEEVLALAADRDDVAVESREFSPAR